MGRARVRLCVLQAIEQGGVKVTRQFGDLGIGLAIFIRNCTAARFAAEGAVWVRAPHSSSSCPAEGKAAQMRLLLGENHHDTARTISRLLRSAGFSVTTASDVASASAPPPGYLDAALRRDVPCSGNCENACALLSQARSPWTGAVQAVWGYLR